MIEQLSQDTITEYASDAQTIQEPQGSDYSQGVAVGKTIPAKWWNWLFRAVTKRAGQAKADAQDMLTEMQNVVTDAGIALDSADNTQLSQAIDSKADIQIAEYVREKKMLAALWQVVEPNGLLPIPAPQASKRFTWILDPKKAGEVFWSVHGIETMPLGGGDPSIAYEQIVFSKDLINWHSFDPTSVDPQFVTKPSMSASVIFFKGTYYMCISGVNQLVSAESVYAILSSQDTEHWSTEVIFRQTGSNRHGVVFSVFDKIMWAAGSRLYTSTDGANWSYTSLPSGVYASRGLASGDLANMTAEIAQMGDAYIVGEVLVSENSVTPLVTASCFGNCKVYKLKQGNVVLASGYTVDSSFTVTPIFTDTTWDSISGMLRDGEFLIMISHISSTFSYKYTTDGITFNDLVAPLYANVDAFYSKMPVCEFDGKFYYSNKNDFSIFESEDLVHWTDTGNKATSAHNICSLELIGILVSDTKYSLDKGHTWLQAKDSNNNDFCGYKIIAELGAEYFTTDSRRNLYNSNENYYTRYTMILFTGNYVNRVIGHTLYLK